MAEKDDRNREVLEQLRKYVPEGCIGEGEPVPVRGRGSWYEDAAGKWYLDFSSGIFTNTFGHGCERLCRAGEEQARLLANIHGRHSEAELRFYRCLFPYLPGDDYRAIPYNDGGYAIDRGLTDIINYFGRRRIGIGAYRNGFHGKTQGAKLLINETEKATFYDNFQIDFPHCYRCPWKKNHASCSMECAEEACRILEEKKAGALVYEPVQGSGIVIPPRPYWEIMQQFCRKQGILMFADEVLTGGGRTGEYLASVYFGTAPDMIALTKGLANGKPLSLLLEREYITQNPYGVRPMERSSTFAGHPEALAVAAELLKMLEEESILEHVRRCGELLKQGLLELYGAFPEIGDVRSLGLMGAVEFVGSREGKEPHPGLCARVFEQCREQGLETIRNGNILRLAPPLNIKEEDLLLGIRILRESIFLVRAGGVRR